MLSYLPLFFSLASAANLYATHYSGTVYSLSLDNNNNGSYSLSIASQMKTCGSMPSWLTFDASSRILYCSDESGNGQTKASLTALSAAKDGKLKEIAKAPDVGAGVHSVIYDGEGGHQYIAIAHYGGSALSTFRLPLKTGEDNLQVFRYKLSGPGTRPQQDASHPHEVILDPTGSFVLSPDLGADVIRVYAIDRTSGKLNACPSLNFTAGAGPRHGLFWNSYSTDRHEHGVQKRTSKLPETFLYNVDELDGHLHAFKVSYPQSGCLAFKEVQSTVPYAHGKLPEGATPAEIRMVGDHIYVSIRSDHGFPPNDSMATLHRSKDGTVTFGELTSAYGTVPRTFVINKAGDLVAIGDQSSSNVAIVKRDSKTGKLGKLVANLKLGEPGQVGTSTGLSSIIWDE